MEAAKPASPAGKSAGHERSLWIAFGLTSTFLVAEVVAGLVTNSLALLSDAAHMGTDVIALGVSLFAIRMSRKPADARRTYGYARMEAIGALINGGLLFVVAAYILWEAASRFRAPPEVASTGMLVVAVLGLIVNMISMRLLTQGSKESLNLKGAYLEVWSDLMGSVGVIVAALVIRFTGWQMVDPILAVVIGLFVLPRTWILLRSAGSVLMQGVPEGMNVDDIRDAMQARPGVRSVHDLHVWALGSREPTLTAHILLSGDAPNPDAVRSDLLALLARQFQIREITLQVESAPLPGETLHA